MGSRFVGLSGGCATTPAAIVARLKDEQLVQSFSQYQRAFRELDQFGGLKSPENESETSRLVVEWHARSIAIQIVSTGRSISCCGLKASPRIRPICRTKWNATYLKESK